MKGEKMTDSAMPLPTEWYDGIVQDYEAGLFGDPNPLLDIYLKPKDQMQDNVKRLHVYALIKNEQLSIHLRGISNIRPIDTRTEEFEKQMRLLTNPQFPNDTKDLTFDELVSRLEREIEEKVDQEPEH
jgi:hypothetical protein